VLNIVGGIAREQAALGSSLDVSHLLMDEKSTIPELELDQLHVEHGLSVHEEGGLEGRGSSEDDLAAAKDVAERLVHRPVCLLAVAVAVDGAGSVSGDILGHVLTAAANQGCLLSAVCA
jgi:hypothetical protein